MSWPIQTPSVGAALQRLFGLQGRVRPALEEFIVPTVSVGDLQLQTIPPATGIASISWSQAGVAGERATARLEVPGGTLAEILSIDAEFAGNGSIIMNFPGNAATVSGLANTTTRHGYLDGRVLKELTVAGPASVLTYGTQVAAIGFQVALDVQNAVPRQWTFPRGLVIGTGEQGTYGFLEIQFNAVNTACTRFNIMFREYSVT